MSAVWKAGDSARIRPDPADIARIALRWWFDELRACIPPALKSRSSGAPAAFGCTLLPDGRVAFAPLAMGQLALPGETEAIACDEGLERRIAALVSGAPQRTVHVSVPVGACLVRRSRIPARALSHAGAILRHEVEALVPAAAQDVLADWYVETENPETHDLDLVQIVLLRERIAFLLEPLVAAGLSITRLTVGDAEGRPAPVDLMGGREPSLRAWLLGLPGGTKLALGLAALLLAAAPLVAIARQDAALEAMASERARLAGPGARAGGSGAAATELAALAAGPTAGSIIDEIARRLPTGAVLTRLHLATGEAILAIEGVDDETGRAAFAASPLMRSVERIEGAPGTLVLRLANPTGGGAAP
ncbi:hypothetical protein [Aureimonas sp. AU12]|uniref:hypothetical protein n=1 Tax=Aureimonas sp. AU12 TaxID=1638161 RepID=UPI000782D354|nr:hypothetical protein [Aureimonas sp. AU12]